MEMDNVVEQLNRFDEGGFLSRVGFVLETATEDRVAGYLDLQPHHLQPMGIVHGGVYTTIIESTASIGAALTAMKDGKGAAGIENHTSFIRSTGAGRVRAEAVPLQRGRRLHLWRVEVTDEQGRMLAHGTVRLAILELRGEGAGGA